MNIHKTTWFDPPDLVNMKGNIHKIFLSLLKIDFPKSNKLHNIFNKNNVKISYNCMRSISSRMEGYEKSLIQPKSPSMSVTVY